MVNGETKIIFNKLFRLYVIRLSLMIFFKQILYLIYSKYLLDLYDNKKQVITIIDNFYLSLNQFNFFLKIAICIFLLCLLIMNTIFIIIFFYQVKLNHFSKVIKFVNKFPYFKNLNNFLIANLLLHSTKKI